MNRNTHMVKRFHDRSEAGRLLGLELRKYAVQKDALVLALPRGGVPVGFEVAQALKAPLDVFVVRKLGVPGHEEVAMGAIASGGVRVLNEEVIRSIPVSDTVIERVNRIETARTRISQSRYCAGGKR